MEHIDLSAIACKHGIRPAHFCCTCMRPDDATLAQVRTSHDDLRASRDHQQQLHDGLAALEVNRCPYDNWKSSRDIA